MTEAEGPGEARTYRGSYLLTSARHAVFVLPAWFVLLSWAASDWWITVVLAVVILGCFWTYALWAAGTRRSSVVIHGDSVFVYNPFRFRSFRIADAVVVDTSFASGFMPGAAMIWSLSTGESICCAGLGRQLFAGSPELERFKRDFAALGGTLSTQKPIIPPIDKPERPASRRAR